MPLLLVLCAASFVSAFSSRILDPLVPSMARDLQVDVATIALLSSAYTCPYALSQPILGTIGDQFGKERVLKMCVAMLALSMAATVFAPNYSTLFVARVLAGISGGGIIPVAFALVGDKVAVGERQTALARVVMASQTAVLLGSPLSGLIAEHFDWRAIFVVATMIASGTFLLMALALPSPPRADVTPLSLDKIRGQYATVLANPLAPTLLAAVAIEGMTLFGFLPYVAHRIETLGLGGAREAGLVISAMSVGGITFTMFVRQLLRLLGAHRLIRVGGVITAVGLAGIAYSPSWQVEALMFAILGFGFFSMHNCLQLQATELAPSARSTAMALFAFCFFLGQALGPVLYQAGFATLGGELPVVMGGLLLMATSFFVAHRLRPKSAE